MPNSSPTCSEMAAHHPPSDQHPLDQLALADPQTAALVRKALAADNRIVSTAELDLLVTQTIEALAMATAFGQAVAHGFLRLVGRTSFKRVELYAERLATTRREGAGLGQLLAEHLPAVLLAEDASLLEAFDTALATLLTKGVYALKGPLEQVSQLLDQGEKTAALAFLELLDTCFGLPLTYNRSIYMTQFLPQAVTGMNPPRRSFQIAQLARVMRVDQRLAEPFIEGLGAGAAHLSESALTAFVSYALASDERNSDGVRRFLALEARSARVFCEGLQISVPLAAVQGQLSRYLQARLGRQVPILNLEALPGGVDNALVYADGRCIYLPLECDHYGHKDENRDLYKLLVKLEAACFEFGSFDFDMQRFNLQSGCAPLRGAGADADGLLDIERFFQAFSIPALAEVLFTVFEHGRLRQATTARYPGLARQMRPLLAAELKAVLACPTPSDLLLPLYAAVALGVADQPIRQAAGDAWPMITALMARVEDALAPGRGVEASARLAQAAYAEVEAYMGGSAGGDVLERFWTPFGHRLRPALVRRAFAAHERTARRLRRVLAQRGVRLFQSDLRKRLQRQEGFLSPADLYQLTLASRDELPPPSGPSQKAPGEIRLALSDLDLSTLLGRAGSSAASSPTTEGEIFRYPEWDAQLSEYLTGHTLVREQCLPEVSDPFYRRTLEHHPGLVARIRHAFELLKPQGLKLLRPWREGDSFDYRAMLDFAIDKKAGRMPSDRLYIKPIKHQRDVAVLLLVDLSRSTANLAHGTDQTVLGVTQTAIVLFCEALQVVGDSFAIAGFSGTGRLGVDYLRIKDFGDPMDPNVEGRIAAMTPLRATRMGAAIRHATRRLGEVPAAVRLLMVLGDGFPNDTEYKGLAAIADTRRAIQEARAHQIHTKGITVNIGSDARLDDLYGRAHHTVFQDVRELPDRLFQIYGRLTRS